MLFPWIMSESCCVSGLSLPLKGAAGEHMLAVMHGCADKRVHGHALMQIVTPPPHVQLYTASETPKR